MRRIRRTAFLLALLAGAVAPLAAVSAESGIELGAGRTILIRLAAPARSVVIGDPSVADVSVEAPTLLALFGKRAGGTTLTVLGAGRNVIVESRLVVHAGGFGAVSVTYGAGKNVEPGGKTIAYACGLSGCAYAPEDRKSAAAQKPASE